MARSRAAARLHLLSVKEVQAAGNGDHGDGGGLLLRVRDQSTSWVFRFTSPSGRRREMGLGSANRANAAACGDSLTTARKQAHEAREQLALGVDPISARERRREAAEQAEAATKVRQDRARWTLARCARDYHERVIEPRRSDKHGKQWISSIENHMPASLWNKAAEEVEPPELLRALQGIKHHERARNVKGDKPHETVQRIRQRLDAVFEDAMFHKRCSSNPAAAIRRKMREGTGRRQRGHFASLPYADAPAFMLQLRAAEGLAPRALELLLLAVARTAEIRFAEKSEFDLDAAKWVVPAAKMKAGEEHVVYLSPRAVDLIREISEMKLDRRWLFPSLNKPGRPMSNMALLAALGRLGMRDHTTVHGLRATFSTWANETGAARPDVVEACLAHEESNRVRAAYNRAEFATERRQLLGAWANFLTTPCISNVLPLRAA